MISVFISYAREDDEPFVRRLCADLETAEFSIWFDRTDMPGRGRTFLHELRDAIDGIDRVVAVIGPAAMTSQYVQAELEHAAIFAKAVAPVLRRGDYDALPPSLALFQCVDFRDDAKYRDALSELRRILAEPTAPLGPLLSLVPSIAPHFVPRPTEMNALRDAVLADLVTPVVIGPDRQAIAMVGLAGCGKSSLAATFARAAETRRAFVDGCLWITAGERADLGSMLLTLGAAMGDDPKYYALRETALTRLPNLFAARSCLIVIDDVWDLDAVTPFLNGIQSRSRLLITTRELRIATALGTTSLSLDGMERTAGLKLLCTSAGSSDSTWTSKVAERCGYLPLALALCGGLVRNGLPWADVDDALAAANLNSIQGTLANYPHRTLVGALRLSFDMLARGSKAIADRYLSLAVFPKSEWIPEAAVTTLWAADGVIEREARSTLATLAGRSLIQLGTTSERRGFRIHDLLMDFIKGEAGENERHHEHLLNAYQRSSPGGWPHVVPDGYIFEHLPYHLRRAGRTDELQQLLVGIDYLQAKLNATSIGALLRDFDGAAPDADVVRGALILSATALAKEPAQLPAQLLGRLSPTGTALSALLCRAGDQAPRGALLPTCACLTPPDSSLRLFLADASPLAIDTKSRRLYTLERSAVTVRDLASGALIERLVTGVTSASATSDGRCLLTQHGDASEWSVWSLPEGGQRGTLSTGNVRVACVSHYGGHYLLTSTDDGELGVWDCDECRQVALFDSQVGPVTSNLAASRGARQLVGATGAELHIWDVEHAALRFSYPEQQLEIDRVAITADATTIYTTAPDGLLRVWGVEAQEELTSRYPGGGQPVLVRVTEQGVVVTCAPFSGVSVWNPKTMERQKTCSESSADFFVVSADATMAATSGTHERRLRVWNLQGSSDRRIGHDYSARRVAVDATGRYVVSAAYEELKLWDVRSGRELMSSGGDPCGFGGWHHVTISPCAKRIVADHYDKGIFEWPRGSREPRKLPIAGELVGMSGDGERLAVRVGTTEVGVFDRRDRLLAMASINATESLESLHLTMSPDLQTLYQFFRSGLVVATAMRSDTELARIKLGDKISPWSGVAAEDALWWANSRSIVRWDVQADPQAVCTYGTVGGIFAVSDNGRAVVCGTDRDTIRVYDNQGVPQGPGLTLDGEIESLAISYDGSLVVAGDKSGRVSFAEVNGAANQAVRAERGWSGLGAWLRQLRTWRLGKMS